MGIDRRKFLKKGILSLGIAAGGAVGFTKIAAKSSEGDDGTRRELASLTTDGKLNGLPLEVLNPAESRKGVPGRMWVMVIDLSRCAGPERSGYCMTTCAKMHHVNLDPKKGLVQPWIKVLTMPGSEHSAPYYFPQPCYHCDSPPCTKVCPVDATFKREDGIVLIDNERCVGCRFCMAACPYAARSFNWGDAVLPAPDGSTYSPEHGFPRRRGTVEKCDFCPDMARNGDLPICVSACPNGTIFYGDQNEDAVTNSQGETLRLSKLIKDGAAYRHNEDLGTNPRVYYLPPRNRRFPVVEKGKLKTNKEAK